MKTIMLAALRFLRDILWSLLDLLYALIKIRTIVTGSIRYEENRKRLLILGTGPSLKSELPRILSLNTGDLEIMCCNSFCLLEEFFVLKPHYYVMADPGYWKPDADPVSVEQRRVTFLRFQKVDWEIVLIVPTAARGYDIRGLVQNDRIRLCYLNSLPMRFRVESLEFLAYQFNIFAPAFLNVMITCIFSAVNMGFKDIRLYGADHSWHENIRVESDNFIYIVEDHCYDNEPVKRHRMEWVNSVPITMGEVFIGWGKVFSTYNKLRKYAEARGVSVLNCSSKSYIDAFDRGI